MFTGYFWIWNCFPESWRAAHAQTARRQVALQSAAVAPEAAVAAVAPTTTAASLTAVLPVRLGLQHWCTYRRRRSPAESSDAIPGYVLSTPATVCVDSTHGYRKIIIKIYFFHIQQFMYTILLARQTGPIHKCQVRQPATLNTLPCFATTQQTESCRRRRRARIPSVLCEVSVSISSKRVRLKWLSKPQPPWFLRRHDRVA